LLRVWDLDARSLWFDEAGEYWVATAPLSQVPAAVRDRSGDPPLYAMLLHAWMQAGRSEAWLRLLSVVFSVAGVAGAIAVGRQLAGWRAGIGAGLLVTVGASDIRYAQELGQYALMVGALFWSLFALARAAATPDRRNWALWVLTALIASHAYYGAAIAVLVPFACVAIGSVRQRGRMRGALVALAAYAVGMLPLLAVLPAQLSRVVAPEAADASSAPHDTAALLGWIQQPFSFPLTGWPYTPVPSWVSTPLVLALLVLGMRSQRRLAIWFGATWLVSLAADRAGVFPYGFRWGLIVSPFLSILVAAGLISTGGTRSTGRARGIDRAATAAFVVLLALGVASLPNRSLRDRFFPDATWPWPETEDLGPLVETWRAHRTPSQPTYVYYGAAPAFAYYASRTDAALAELPPTWDLACWHDGSPAFCRANGIYFGRWLRRLNQQQKLLSIFNSFRDRPREFWIVFGHIQPADDTEILSALKLSGYEIVSAAQGKDAAVFLVRRS
jgi:uncharacterized membrane protein